MAQLLSTFPLLVFFFIYCAITSAQSPAQAPAAPGPTNAPPVAPGPTATGTVPLVAPGPATAGPTNVSAIFEKAGPYNTINRLLKSTQMGNRITTQLNTTNQGITIFAPNDSAFAKLKTGTLNAYTDQQKNDLIAFHVIASVIPLSQFQTVTNPLTTEAGGNNKTEFPMNVTMMGKTVGISTGIVNATVVNTIYTDNQLAIYQVDKVLFPMHFFVTPSPAPAPSIPKKAAPSLPASSASVESSDAICLIHQALHATFFVTAISTVLFSYL